jgi:hypothetical protein
MFHRLFLEGNLQSIEWYIKNYEFASHIAIILPLFLGLLLIFLLKFLDEKGDKNGKLYIFGIFILIAVLVGLFYLFSNSMKDHVYTFMVHFLFYLIPLVLLWFLVYTLHCAMKSWFLKSQTSGGSPRSRAGGACEAPPHKN